MLSSLTVGQLLPINWSYPGCAIQLILFKNVGKREAVDYKERVLVLCRRYTALYLVTKLHATQKMEDD